MLTALGKEDGEEKLDEMREMWGKGREEGVIYLVSFLSLPLIIIIIYPLTTRSLGHHR